MLNNNFIVKFKFLMQIFIILVKLAKNLIFTNMYKNL